MAEESDLTPEVKLSRRPDMELLPDGGRGHVTGGVLLGEVLHLLEAVLQPRHQPLELLISHLPQLCQRPLCFLFEIKSGDEFEELPGLLVLLTGRDTALHGELVHVAETLAKRPPVEDNTVQYSAGV